jgi:[acyl-carrier-protein] S-malonyltransferase
VSLALLFPGQGTQHPQMLPWLEQEAEAQPLLAAMAQVIGADWRNALADAKWSTSNAVAQPLLVGIELATWRCLRAVLPAPAVVVGYSVGELSAFAAAGVFDAQTALALSSVRARCMDDSVQGLDTGLLAVADLPLDAIAAWAARHALSVAIRLGPDRAIVGGKAADLQVAAQERAVAHARFTPIAARVASHTPWMQPAAAAFAQALAAVPLQTPQAATVCNFTGEATRRPAELQRCLSAQMASTVLWDSCMETIAERGVRCALEVGPGTTLATLWRNAHPQIPVRSADEFRSARAVADWVARSCA